ncbi:TPA: hypothetical protein H1941_000955 [Salmonella enterica]|uniref:Fimbrial protein n=1 Tax=Salmonella enterica TaxID=28901 RepID=A0A746I4H3_SALER|nr:hypothetical protein [Salmonella enterica]HAF3780577.1 hypothetical protein [Salmonella enterica]HAF5258413.1 hypothetical protein [Salmonella enterica]HAK2252067.1 hypothetical protein [Salmonella enterica]HAK2417487.1 hypothetical protein [Salmonella enterica]HAK2443476.1 hypothetical protein [Salmonella enterica]
MCRWGTCIYFILCSGFAQAATSATATATVNITVSNPRPTCDINVRSSYSLDMEPGEKKYSSFPVSINCTGVVRTALTAQNVGGELQSNGYQVAVSLTNSGTGTKPLFWLIDSNKQNIQLTGGGNFCDATQQYRECELVPVTKMQADSGWGTGAITVRFNVVYPA